MKVSDQTRPPLAVVKKASRTAPRYTALRRRRLQLAHYLRLVASLRDEADEMRAEISALELIIHAQSEAITALRHQKNGVAK